MSDRRPRLVYDDDCGFCTWCAQWAIAHGEFEPVGFDELEAGERARLPENYQECVHLLAEGEVHSCGKATEEVLARTDTVPAELFDFLSVFSDYERLRENAYRFVADRRDQLGFLVSSDGPVRRR